MLEVNNAGDIIDADSASNDETVLDDQSEVINTHSATIERG